MIEPGNKDSDRHDPKYTAYQNLSGFKNAIFDLTQLYMGLSGKWHAIS
jgi:hypothetical protein